MRGEMPLTVPAREFALTLSDGPREGGPFRVEVVNAMGLSMWSGLVESSPTGIEVKVHVAKPGTTEIISRAALYCCGLRHKCCANTAFRHKDVRCKVRSLDTLSSVSHV